MFPVAFLARELAPTHRRVAEAARNALKTALTTAIAATLQILGPFGSLFAFRIGQPGINLGLFEGGLIIVCAAAMQAAIVPITGKLLDYPGLLMLFLFVVFALIAYLLSNTRLFLILALVAVGTITTVYVGIFEPGQIGWGSTYTFDGILAATLVMVAIDLLIWPSPAEPKLLESVAADLEHARERLRLVGLGYLDSSTGPLPPAEVASRLASHLALLKSIEEREKPTPEHRAALLDAVLTSERLFLEVEHLAVIADQPQPRIAPRDRDQVILALSLLDAAFARRIRNTLADLSGQSTEEGPTGLPAAIDHLRETTLEVQSSNLPAFVSALKTIASLLEPEESAASTTAEETEGEVESRESRPSIDMDRFRFSVKLGATMVLGLLVGLTTQRADLQTILWTIAVAGQPNQYGAVIRKTILRLTGCILGGLAALAAMILVSQNFDSLIAYAVAIFAVAMFSTYVAQSSEWLGYAGIQTGITFLICYVGLGPSSDIYKPLWRFWGIVLGILTTGFVFLFLSPEYASDRVLESLGKLTEATLGFGKEVAEKSITEGRIAGTEGRLSANLLEVLNMADQARLEGRRGSAISASAVEAAGLLIRIAYRLKMIALARLAGSESDLPQSLRERCNLLEQKYCGSLESGLAKLRSVTPPEQRAAGASTRGDIGTASTNTEQSGAPAVPEMDSSTSVSGNYELRLEPYRRMSVLLSQLDSVFSRIAAF